MQTPAIAIVGMACRYPDATSPSQLWENVLAKRQAFRQFPPARLNPTDYWSPDPAAPDQTYACQGAFIEGYEFDRVAFRVAGSTFRAADLVHWLTLDIAAQALEDAGFADGVGLPRDTTGVLLGNTLTGEFSRANSLRLRWPYVRRVVDAQLAHRDWTVPERQAFLQALEASYKAPFSPIGSETLAGNLANTIAGRICNHFDLKGGGYTVDGACASSNLAVTQACTSLVVGDLDVALAGGVDLSLDPFELVGFAKAGALAAHEMRVYDQRAEGFWPGEGCGLVVLMRAEDAISQQRPIYAVIRGWGVSSDGQGGITRPEVEGQLLAVNRAYRRAGYGAQTVGYFEGHGTGTPVGDATELQVLMQARQAAGAQTAAVIGSIKTNIGHTKAAAGVAGLIKATMALHTQTLPPHTGCQQPHAVLMGDAALLKVLPKPQVWSDEQPLRASISAMGFGGINTHLALEAAQPAHQRPVAKALTLTPSVGQDAELLVFSAPDQPTLAAQIETILGWAPRLSRAEVTDLAGTLAGQLNVRLPVRAAVIATTPTTLTQGLTQLLAWIEQSVTLKLDPEVGIYLNDLSAQTDRPTSPRIGFLFPGQAAPVRITPQVWGHRFPDVQALYEQGPWPETTDLKSTAVAQPAITTAALAGIQVLDHFGLTATVGIGHSLGEFSALHWAGVLDQDSLLRITKIRGQAMAELGDPTGTMASLKASASQVEDLIQNTKVVIAGYNSPQQTIISGTTSDIERVCERAIAQGYKAMTLPVSHAFHSPLIAAALPPLVHQLAQEDFQPLQRRVVSTITGQDLEHGEDLRSRLAQQVTQPVRFLDAITHANPEVDLWIEVGPGQILSRLAAKCCETVAISLDTSSHSLQGLLKALGAAFVLGAPVRVSALFVQRLIRPFDLNWQPQFFVNPCELAPGLNNASLAVNIDPGVSEQQQSTTTVPPQTANGPLEIIRQLVAARAELPPAAIQDHDHLLGDLHLNSITVGQIVAEAARALDLPPSAAPTQYADATIIELSTALADLIATGSVPAKSEPERIPAGVDAWVRSFVVEWHEQQLLARGSTVEAGDWQLFAPVDAPLTPLFAEVCRQGPGDGILVYLPDGTTDGSLNLLWSAAQAQLASETLSQFVLVQHDAIGSGFVRTLHLEQPHLTTYVITIPEAEPQAAHWVLAEIQATPVDRRQPFYREARYDAQGHRQVPILCHLPLDASTVATLTPNDVLLVTGGGKGIAAECALALARQTGVKLALLGRSHPEADPELRQNLQRMHLAEATVYYLPTDVTNPDAVQAAIHRIQQRWGPVTGILHGAGLNHPKLIRSLTKADIQQTLAPKVIGLTHLLDAIDTSNLHTLITFGSIIAHSGLPGEADYALANEWLANHVQAYKNQHPHCRCLNLAWSIWSGVGMGERLGRIDALLQQGITPIPPAIGVEWLQRLLSVAPTLPQASVVIAGRFGHPPTVQLPAPELPMTRFIETVQVHYPGIELVVDAQVSTGTDPYVNDHVLEGDRIFPAVMCLEAMAQVVSALTGTVQPPTFTDVKFNRPIIIPETDAVTIRIAALLIAPDHVRVVLRSEQTGFSVDHVNATCWVPVRPETSSPVTQMPIVQPPDSSSMLALSSDDLYGKILFHRGRFQRLHSYRWLRAQACIANITASPETPWFSQYLPQDFILDDPGARDAAIHALQACIPHRTLLPVGVDRITIFKAQYKGPRSVSAQECHKTDDSFTYNLVVFDADGHPLEQWQGLQLQAMPQARSPELLNPPLLGPYLERCLQRLIPTADINISLDNDATQDRSQTNHNDLSRFFPFPPVTPPTALRLTYRPDGKPELPGPMSPPISIAHTNDLTFAISGTQALGCDVEPVATRAPEMWQALLGIEYWHLAHVLCSETQMEMNTVCTGLWAASECQKKAGVMARLPLVFGTAVEDWFTLNSAAYILAIGRVPRAPTALVFAILTSLKQEPCSPGSGEEPIVPPALVSLPK